MTEPTRPPTLRAFLEAGCDLSVIPDLEQYARVIVIGAVCPPEGVDVFAARMRLTAESWLRGEPASLVDDGVRVIGSFEQVRQFLWLSEGLTDPVVAERFADALPPEVWNICVGRITELQNEIRGGTR